jgi:predicted polyphosphate/ATP-dependent NAD kinase
MVKVGFLVNPIAGMGGRVGLKGTDGDEILKRARELGAEPVAQKRALETINLISGLKVDIHWLTCSKEMGEDVLKASGFKVDGDYEIIHNTQETSSAQDTKNACSKFKEMNVDLILFCGGDGTARDIFSVIGKDIPIIGIPAGVKMFSAVFAVNPESAAEVVIGFLRNDYDTIEAEVMDIDEEAYRGGNLDAKLFGYAKTPFEETLVQSGKSVYRGVDEETTKEEIARYVVELMKGEEDTLFILGAGSTVEAIGKELNIDKTLLGVDIVKNGQLITKDVNEKQLLELLDKENNVQIIIGIIGSQGFVFGRGNQQISPDVIKKVGIEGIKIVATPQKMSQTPILRVDTGDNEIDKSLSGHHKVIVGYHEMRMAKIKGGKN